MQPAQPSAARIWASLTGRPLKSPSTTMSDTARRPPGLRTRNASCKTAPLSGERLITQFEIIVSTVASGSGMFSISPLINATFDAPARSAFRRATASISSVISRPYTYPPGPTRCAASSTSSPPPDPRSSTTSPAWRPAIAIGLPQPNEVVITSLGSAARVASPYSRSSVLAVSLQHELELDNPQQLLP